MTTLPPRTPLRASRLNHTKPGRSLSLKQKRFVDEYLLDMNATAAAIRAGYSEISAYSHGAYLTRRPNVAAAIEARLAERRARLTVTTERVIHELARIAFADIGRIITWSSEDMAVTPPELLSADDRAAIAEIAVVKRNDTVATRVILHDKERALEALCRHLGLFTRAGQGQTHGLLPPERTAELREMLRVKIEKRVAERVEEELAARAAAERQGAPKATAETGPESV